MATNEAHRGRLVERKAWILLALIAGVMIVFGTQMLMPPDLHQPITGSKCCNGKVLADATPWMVDYARELAKYMGTFTILAGVLAMAVVVVPFRRRQRWAWNVMWALPLLFLVHGAWLGSFPFDFGPLGVTTLGLVLSARLFHGAPAAGHAPSVHATNVVAAE